MTISSAFRILCGTAAVLLIAGQTAEAANYPLEITNIKPQSSNVLSSNSRIYRAYTGIEYNIRPAIVGGAYPFTFSLINAPVDMTVDTDGTIRWANPQGTISPTLTVTDAEGTTVSVNWSITASTTGFKFVDGVNGRSTAANGCSSSCGTGTISNPWRTIEDVYENAAWTDIVYFRNGTYDVLTLPRVTPGDYWERVEISGGQRATQWLAYPGSSPVIDLRYSATQRGPFIRMSGSGNLYPYLDGFEVRNAMIMAFQMSSTAFTFRRMTFHDLLLGGDGTNASFIMTTAQSGGAVSTGSVIQDSTFYGITAAAEAVALKLYSQEKTLIEDNVFYNIHEAVHIKGDVRRFSVRANTFYNIGMEAVGGNMHGLTSPQTVNGEILFNNISSSMYALSINQDGYAAEVFIQRNTLRGRIWIRNTDASDGPFRFTHNVIINNDSGTPAGSHIYHDNVTAPSRIVLTENLVGYPSNNIVDANGLLTPAYANYIGLRGHQLTDGPTGPVPAAPTGLRLITE